MQGLGAIDQGADTNFGSLRHRQVLGTELSVDQRVPLSVSVQDDVQVEGLHRGGGRSSARCRRDPIKG